MGTLFSKRRRMIKIAIVVCLAALAAAEAEADAWYGPYGYTNNWGHNMMYGNNMNNMFWNMPGYSQGYRQMNYMNGHEGHRYQSFDKREAEAEPEAFYGPYSYSNFGNNWPMNYNNMYNNMWNQQNMYQYNMPGYSQGYRQMNDMNGHEGHRYQSFNKREAEADAWYQPYGYSNWGYNMMNGNNMMSYWNRPYNMMYNYRYHF